MNTPDPQKALETAKARKDTGDKAFQAGELQTGAVWFRLPFRGCDIRLTLAVFLALRSYHEVDTFVFKAGW